MGRLRYQNYQNMSVRNQLSYVTWKRESVGINSKPEGQFIVPDWGDKVDYGIALIVVPARDLWAEHTVKYYVTNISVIRSENAVFRHREWMPERGGNLIYPLYIPT
jgi:hypothetical protein